MRTCHNCLYAGDVIVCNRCAGAVVDKDVIGVESFWEERPLRGKCLEQDPNGISASTPGAKLDAGKNRLGLVLCGFSRALQEVGKVGTFGANKYTDNGWVEVQDGERRYTDAMFRHVLKESSGEKVDVDSGLLHAAHAAWNALARLDLMLRKSEK